MNISPNQKKAIKTIEKCLNIKFKGKTMEEASDFIEKNLEASKKIDLRTKMPPSAKMKKGIDLCEDVLGVKFQGATMKDASEFLDTYLKQAFEEIEMRKGRRNGSKSNK